MLENAREAMEQSLSNSATAEQSQENSQSPQTTQSEAQTTANQPADILELDKLERFKYDNREWTPAELKSAIMMNADYTRKTKEIAEERKYYDALAADLKYVRENPQAAEEFRKIYPEKFHSYLDFAAINQAQAHGQNHQQVQAQQQYAQLPPEFLEQFKELRSAWQQQETEKESVRIDTLMKSLSSKYDKADERVVLATIQAAHKPGQKLTDEQWERVYKAEHERMQALLESHQKKQIEQQREANKKARDAGPGGGTPGQAPVKRSFKEARDAAIAHFEGQN